MARPTTNVIFQFSEGVAGATFRFTLNDPVTGVLNNTTYTLGGEYADVDVTQYVRRVSIQRGRSRVLDRVDTGRATIVLDNRARLFDPTAGTAISPYTNEIVPRKNVRITVAGGTVFTGQVDDWNIDYQLGGDSTTTALCVDGFGQLAGPIMGTQTRTSQVASARVSAVLDEIGWPNPPKRVIQTSTVTLQADTPTPGTNALTYLQTVADTEFGALFMNRQGAVEFQNRASVQNFGTTVILGGTGIPISSVQVSVGSELLFNTITLTRNLGGTVVRQDATSAAAYGELGFTKDGYLFDSDTAMGNLADYLLSRYKDSTLRIDAVSIMVSGLTAAQQETVAGFDVNAPMTVTFQPAVGSAITQTATIDSIAHDISPANHVMTVTLSQAQPSFILNSATFGELDDDRLGF